MRVLAGVARRALLVAPEGLNTRPSADRAKESLFNIIASEVPGARFLDIFCGSGAIGIEALSRGAQKAVFVDTSALAIKAVRDNLSKTKLTNSAETLHMSAEKSIVKLAQEKQQFNIIFLDPPYNSQLLSSILKELPRILAKDGIIVAETDAKHEANHTTDGLSFTNTRICGRTKFLFFTLGGAVTLDGDKRMILIYPGSFDPVTTGHIDIANRAAKFAGRLIITVLDNFHKETLFSVQERISFLKEAFSSETIEIDSYSGFLVEYARQKNAHAILRGIRTSEDFEHENKYAASNTALSNALFGNQIETIFIPASPALSHVSSSIIKEVAAHIYKTGLNDSFIAGLVPPSACIALRNKFQTR